MKGHRVGAILNAKSALKNETEQRELLYRTAAECPSEAPAEGARDCISGSCFEKCTAVPWYAETGSYTTSLKDLSNFVHPASCRASFFHGSSAL